MASEAGGAKPGWNIFARTLEDLVLAHGAKLWQLGDIYERPEDQLKPGDPQKLAHPQKAGRLIESLNALGTFPVVNPDDLERISRYFHFDRAEERRLSVALLANAVERLIYERLYDKTGGEAQKRFATAQALRIVESMLPSLGQAFDELGDDDAAAFRGGPTSDVGDAGDAMWRSTRAGEPPSDEHIKVALADALDTIDRATLALQLSYSAQVSAERLAQARAARDAYSDALAALDEQTTAIRASALWQVWHVEARHGHDEADERVIDLGG